MDRRAWPQVWPWRSRWRRCRGSRRARSMTRRCLKPADGEWVGYGRDYAETHHSPLTQIDQTQRQPPGRRLVDRSGIGRQARNDAAGLQRRAVWHVDVEPGLRDRSPHQQDQVAMGSRLSCAAASTAMGPRPCCGPVNRGVALYDGKVYVGTARWPARRAQCRHRRAGVVGADDAAEQRLHDHRRAARHQGQGRDRPGRRGVRRARVPRRLRCANRQAGVEVLRRSPAIRRSRSKTKRWRVAAKTWNGQWWKYGGGGTPWDGIAYDPELNLVYVGTGNGSPWNAQHRSPGGGDNLYLASIVALNADTGKYVWHYQTTPGDNWDYNAAQPMILADLTIANQPRKVIMQAPKNGFFYVLDRVDRQDDLRRAVRVHVRGRRSIDKETGRPMETEQARYRNTPVRLSPSPVGAHHWPPMAFNPVTKLVYYPGQETSSVFVSDGEVRVQGRAVEPRHDAAARRDSRCPPPPDPKAPPMGGFFVAWDPVANKQAWRIPFQSSGGALSTAGQLIFVGNSRGQVLRARSGQRQDAVGIAAAARRRRDADQLRARWQAVHRGDGGRSKGGACIRSRWMRSRRCR